MPSLDAAYNWVIKICNDENYGYCQDLNHRNGGYCTEWDYTGGRYCFDCSSLMYYAVTNVKAKDGSGGAGGWTGIENWSSYSKSNAWTTRSMQSGLKHLGWAEHSASEQWQVGDILWRSGHTEMVYKVKGTSGQTMGAHSWYEETKESQVGQRDKSVAINQTTSSNSEWTYLYRAPSQYQDIGTSGSTSQTSGTDDVSKIDWWYTVTSKAPKTVKWGTTEQDNNARKIAAFFLDKGLTYAAICGILGNMAHESYMNPGQMEIGYGGDTAHGYGLIQWTPTTDHPKITLKNWASQKGEKWYDGDFQLQTIWDECTNESEAYAYNLGSVWFTSSTHPEYDYTWSEFCKLTDYKEAMYAFLYERERGSWSEDRLTAAKYYWDYFKTNKVNTSTTTTGTNNDSTNDGSGNSSNVGYVGQARKKLSLSTNKVMVLYNRRF